MCTRGGIILVRRADGWHVEEYEDGKAPSHEHLALFPHHTDRDGYPKLDTFPEGTGILIGHRDHAWEGITAVGIPDFLRKGAQLHLLDGVSLVD